MTFTHSHSCVTQISVPLGDWHVAEPLLETWKTLLSTLPGFVHSEVLGRRLDNGDIRCLIQVTWEYREQLEEFLRCQWAPEVIIGSLHAAVYDFSSDSFEQYM